jgi:hypothetical protein
MKNKVIKGRPDYIYKGTHYLDLPEKTYVKKMVYDEDSYTTKCYCAKHTIIPEILIVLVIGICIYLNGFIIQKTKIDLYYNSISTYYNGELYLNLQSDESNYFTINYYLTYNSEVVYSGVLNPGDLVISVPVSNVQDTYQLKLVYKTFITKHEEVVSINVLDRSS